MAASRPERIAARQADVLTRLLPEAQSWVRACQPLDSGLSRFYHAHPEFGSRDRRLFSGTVFSYFRWKGWIDRIARNSDEACVFAHLLETDEPHAAILALATSLGLPGSVLTPMASRGTREKALSLGALTNCTLPLSLLVPDWIVPLLGKTADAHIEAFQKPPPTWLRTSPVERDGIMQALRDAKTEPQPHPAIASACSIPRGINLRALPRPLRERIDIQDLASQVTGLVCAPKAGDTWWDACCGSGGKTLHLSELGGNTVSILATDVRASILEELAHRMAPARDRSIRTAQWDGLRQQPPSEFFDGVLLDAPCSGTGTWHRNPDARWRFSRERFSELLDLQSRLLRKCAQQVKPGGCLIYATCSILPDENAVLLEQFMKDTPEFSLTPFPSPIDGLHCGGQLLIDPALHACNGMYIARLERTARKSADDHQTTS